MIIVILKKLSYGQIVKHVVLDGALAPLINAKYLGCKDGIATFTSASVVIGPGPGPFPGSIISTDVVSVPVNRIVSITV
ncbi:hypothetical protein PghCCS26_62760 [Paenibacillus glycanilyticus]|uniref:Spore germination protein n=1 Tax=Paenibacillus glycanilyticus TaxID=126569 RepID=A0ABQ6NVN1_9BACL|nr:hypothetical protein PghCCS26_62760 [Paenibacillus glycanilyticus]